MIKKWLISLITAVAIIGLPTLYAVGCHYFPILWDVTQRIWGVDGLVSLDEIIKESITMVVLITIMTRTMIYLIDKDSMKNKEREVKDDDDGET